MGIVDTQRTKTIINESISIMQSTTNVETFFSRYDTVISMYEKLSDGASKKELKKIKDSYSFFINELIDRVWEKTLNKIKTLKSEKAKANQYTKFKESFEQYNNRMVQENIQYYLSKIENN